MTLYCVSPQMAGEMKSKHQKGVVPPKYHTELQKEQCDQSYNQLMFVSHMLNDKSGELFPLCIVVPLTTDVLSLSESILQFYEGVKRFTILRFSRHIYYIYEIIKPTGRK